MSAFHEQFTTQYDVAQAGLVKRAVIIASTQRSGSSLLGHTLRDTGKFGVPLEYFNVQNLEHWKKRFKFSSINQLLDQIERFRTTPNGVFAIKSHYFQLNNVGSIRDLQTRYGDCRFVRIVRRDILAQAISRTVAQQTGVWISGQEKTGEAHYDFTRIAENLRALNQQHQQWSLAFAMTGTDFLTIAHEDLVADAAQTTAAIAEHCEVEADLSALADEPSIKPQSNSKRQEWKQRFFEEFNEDAESLLNGHAQPRDALKDIGRWVRALSPGSSSKEKWYRSPNRARG